MAEYEKFINVIDSFETYSQGVIESCENFIQTATMVGEKIGDIVGKGANIASAFIDNDDDYATVKKIGLGLVGSLAKPALRTAGNAIGEVGKNIKYKTTLRKIYKDGLNWKSQCFNIIPESIEFCKIRVEDSEKKIQVLKANLLKSLSDNDGGLENNAELIHDCIQHFYQSEYRLELANKIIYYFDNFENQLNDLEIFAHWYEESVLVNKIECYKKCYEKTYDVLIDNADEEILDNIESMFQIVDSKVPILVLEKIGNHRNFLFTEASRLITANAKRENFIKLLPEAYYSAEGFKKIVSVFDKTFYGTIIPKYKKFRNLFLILPAIIITILYSILAVSGVFSFHKIIPLNVPEYIYIVIVFIIIELLCFVIVRIKRANIYNSVNTLSLCLKHDKYNFINEVYQICEEYAENEKNIDEKELKALEQESQQNYITQENGEKISEDDFLDSIINK